MIKDNDDLSKLADALFSIEGHLLLTGNTESIVDLLTMQDGGNIELEAPTLSGSLFSAADLS